MVRTSLLGAKSRRRRRAMTAATAVLSMLASPALLPPPTAAADTTTSELRVGVLAVARAISAVGQLPELAEPLPFTRTSLADVLRLDEKLVTDLTEALNGADLEAALDQIEGVTIDDAGTDVDTITFDYAREVESHDLELVYDDGDLRFNGADAGALDVSLATTAPFVVEVDENNPDPLLRVALVGRPRFDLDVAVGNQDVAPFEARQGFTAVDVTGGRYVIDRAWDIVMRDPDGRGVLTLEDLRYSTLPDLFNVEPAQTGGVDVSFDVSLPDDLEGGQGRTGTLQVTAADTPHAEAWPDADDAARDYGAALAAATEVSMADGLTSLAKYTGAALALQQAADVPFPNLDGGTGDLFAPGDELLRILSTAAAAQIQCGVAPGHPPIGVAAPGDTVYCSAVTAEGVGEVTKAEWSTNDSGDVVAGAERQQQAVGPDPAETVRIDASDGEPDVSVQFTVDPPGPETSRELVARSMPRTVQDVVRRIEAINEETAAAASLTVENAETTRLDVSVNLLQPSASADLPLGNADQLGALVGLTGVRAREGSGTEATAPVEATGGSFDVGFGLTAGAVDEEEGESRETVLLPADETLIELDDVSAELPEPTTGLEARIGFLGVTAAVTDLSLAGSGEGPAVALSRAGDQGGALSLDSLLTSQGALHPDRVSLASAITAGVSFTATEQALPGAGYATGADGPKTGSASITWTSGELPEVSYDPGYDELRVFDPVPAAFLTGNARVQPAGPGEDDPADTVKIDVELSGEANLYDELNVPPPSGTQDTEVARRMVAAGLACQNVTLLDADTLTCEGLAPNGGAAFTDGDRVEMIVLGDPFVLRDAIIEGLAVTLAAFNRLAGDNRDAGPADDQYVSTLPLVDLTPAQLALEREALGRGLTNLTAAATEDAGGQGDAQPPVSSAQELRSAVSNLVKVPGKGSYDPSLEFSLSAGRLGIALAASAPSGSNLEAPLRFTVPGPGQVSTAEGFEVGVSSETTLAIDVDVETAWPLVDDATGTTSRATMGLDGTSLADTALQAGVGEFTLGADSTAALDVEVVTDFVPDGDSGLLQTTRSTAGVTDSEHEDPARPAAVADLAVADGQMLHFHAVATDSSGGSGAAQPAPEAMQVKFAAEGLDGLATALEGALDGAAAQNLSDKGAPVSAPLIGTDLDADAGVAGIMRALTSALRTELAAVTAETAEELPAQLEQAAVDAVNATNGLDDITTATAGVTCVGECETCTTPEDGGEPECASAGARDWKSVSISLDLAGVEKQGEAPFDTGLPGLEVRSDKLVDTTTSWTLPITLELVRGVGPQVRIGQRDALMLDVSAALPEGGIDAIVGYLPAHLTGSSDEARTMDTRVTITPGGPNMPAEGVAYDLFELYDGELTAQASFADVGDPEEGLSLDFETLTDGGSPLDLKGTVDLPWTPEDGFDTVAYQDVRMDVGAVVATMAKPFEVVDPYLAPLRDVIDVLRTPIPVVSDLHELTGEGELSLLTLLEQLSTATQHPNLTLAYNVISLVDGVASLMHGLAQLEQEEVPLEDLSKLGDALTVEPTQLLVYEKCTQTVQGTPTRSTSTGKPTCPTVDELAKNQNSRGVRSQTTNTRRTGVRQLKPYVGRQTKEVTASIPGFSLPFLADPNQIMDVLTGEGEASYFRLDLGSLAASISYVQTFGPIMAGPVPISPFVGGSITLEGRLAMGFDSLPQTLAVQSLPHQGDVDTLKATYANDGFDVIDEGFYLDDLDADGKDVPEVKLVVTLEAGAGVSIGIVSAGLKGGITLTIGLDLNDPNDDGRLRTAEIRNTFNDQAGCIFDVKGELEAFIAIFVRIWVLHAPLEYSFDLLRLGPWTLFEYGCETQTPTLVAWEDGKLALTSGDRSGGRLDGATDVSDEYEVRQFDTGGGASGGGQTTYEVSGFGRVQLVSVRASEGGEKDYEVVIFPSAITLSADADKAKKYTTDELPGFTADGGADDDKLSFLRGETFDDEGELVATEFTTAVTALSGGTGNDSLVTGAGNDLGVDGGRGDDSIDVGLGDDVAGGGDGNDTITGGAGLDDLDGAAGNDRVEGGPGADRVTGGAGADGLVGGPGRDVRAVLVLPSGQAADEDSDGVADVVEEQVRLGFDSGDVLVGGTDGDSVDGGDGSDVVVGGEDVTLATEQLAMLFGPGERPVNLLIEGATNPTRQVVPVTTAKVPDPERLDELCTSGSAQSGEGGGDFVTGGAEADVVVGGDGVDRLDGGGGPDEVCGRAGDDRLSGDGAGAGEGSNADVMRGGTGDDLLDAGAGPDVVFGDDVTLFRDDERVLDGSLGVDSSGHGRDHLDGGDGDDILSGGRGADLLLGGPGDDVGSGEGRDSTPSDETATGLDDRLLACSLTTRVVAGKVDLDGDLLAGVTQAGVTQDDGRLAGFAVSDGVVRAPGGLDSYSGLIGEETVVVDGLVDLDRDGDVTDDPGDTGSVPLASVLATAVGNADGDCILAEEGDDQLRGGSGSDYLGAGEGADLALGGDGNDLALGEEGTDVLLGGPHHDVLVGGEGEDHLQGGNGDDRLRGNEGADDLVGGSDASGATDGQDVVIGGRGADVLAAENAAVVSAGVVARLTSEDDPVAWTDEADVPTAVLAGAGSDLRFEQSAIDCAGAGTARWVTLLAQDGEPGTPAQSPGTPLAYDELYGGYDCDWVFGSTGDDVVRGGQDDDVVEGGPGADLANGDAGDDVVVGGSSVDPTSDVTVTIGRSGDGAPDSGDTIHGDGGPDGITGNDLLLGDNATADAVAGAEASFFLDAATATRWTVQLHEVVLEATEGTEQPLGDTMVGDGGSDRVFGQAGDDLVDSGAGDDYAEGNEGADSIAAGAGDDDVIGGTSANDGRPLGNDGGRLAGVLDAAPFDDSAAGVADLGDQIDSGAGSDVVLGDNGRITRPTGLPDGERDIAMADHGSGASTGPDELSGADGRDRIFGQGDDDTITAGDAADHVEGGPGADTAYGQAGDDVVIGGSSIAPAADIALAALPEVALSDAGDHLYGDGDESDPAMHGDDLVLGDNATVLDQSGGASGGPLLEALSQPVWVVQLADASPEGTAGDDYISGGPGEAASDEDRLFGQAGDDLIDAAADDDYVEGNEGSDSIQGGAGDDDVVGGSSSALGRPLGIDGHRLAQTLRSEPGDALVDRSAAELLDGADIIDAGMGHDVLLGDNGRVTRPGGDVSSNTSTQPLRQVAMADLEAGETSGSDSLTGGSGDDVLYGQLDDGVSGEHGTGDALEGGAGTDFLQGDLAVVTPTHAGAVDDQHTVSLTSGELTEVVYPEGSLVPVTHVPAERALAGGPDTASGGGGDDVLRLGADSDLANGGAGRDVVFGGAGADVLWGGPEHDRIFGGYGADDLDLKPRSGDLALLDDLRSVVDTDGDATTTNGPDTIYGGWGADELQADVGEPGQGTSNDYVIDWVGAHNVYYVCNGAYGAPRVVRQSSPDMEDLLLALTRAAGGAGVQEEGSGSWSDLGLVYDGDHSDNTRRSPEHPGNFTCEGDASAAAAADDTDRPGDGRGRG